MKLREIRSSEVIRILFINCGEPVSGFNGKIEKPVEDLQFSVTLRFELTDDRYKNFEASAGIVSSYNGWEVYLNLQTKRPDTE